MTSRSPRHPLCNIDMHEPMSVLARKLFADSRREMNGMEKCGNDRHCLRGGPQEREDAAHSSKSVDPFSYP